MSKRAAMVLSVVVVALLLGVLRGSDMLSAQGGEGVSPQALVTPLLQYQGRLSDPDTGDPVPDGTYQISFRLYTVETGGTSVWSETKDVQVTGGLLSTPLGAVTPLDPHLFNGQMLWLALKVGADAEATPRQPVLPVAYALSLVPGAMVQGDSAPVLEVNHSAAGEALRVTGDLNVTGSLTGGTHTHSGAQITSGTVGEGYIDAAIARDAEVAAAVEAHGLIPDAHHPRYTDGEAWNAVTARDGAGSGLDADLLDGLSSGAFAPSSHTHDARYVNIDGPEVILSKSEEATLEVIQTGPGPALYAEATTGAALHVEGSAVVRGSLAVSGALIGGSHTHSGADIQSGIVLEKYVDGALARDAEVAAAYAPIVHQHDGGDIQSGTIHEKYVDPVIARDSEVMPIVLASDGPGSGLNADVLDGYDSTALFALGESETVSGIPRFYGGTPGSTPPFYVDSTYVVGNLNADYLDGYQASYFLNAMAAAGSTSILGSITASTPTQMDSFTVTPPGAGTLTLVVMGSAFLDCDATSTSSRLCQNARAGICDSANSSTTCGTSWRTYWFEDPDNVTTQNEEHWITVARTVSVSSGARTFYLNGQSHQAGMTWQIYGYVLAIYTPNAMSVVNNP